MWAACVYLDYRITANLAETSRTARDTKSHWTAWFSPGFIISEYILCSMICHRLHWLCGNWPQGSQPTWKWVLLFSVRERSGNLRKMLQIREKSGNLICLKTKRKYMPVWCLYFHCNRSSLQPRTAFQSGKNYHWISITSSWKSQGKNQGILFSRNAGNPGPAIVKCLPELAKRQKMLLKSKIVSGGLQWDGGIPTPPYFPHPPLSYCLHWIQTLFWEGKRHLVHVTNLEYALVVKTSR